MLRSLTSGRARPWTATALALVVVGVLAVLVELQSPSLTYWTGRRVPGVNDGGIVFYRVDGRQYTVDATRTPPAPEPVTVFVSRDDPSAALVDAPTRWVDLVGVAGWFAGALVLLVVGQVRRRRPYAPLPAWRGDRAPPG